MGVGGGRVVPGGDFVVGAGVSDVVGKLLLFAVTAAEVVASTVVFAGGVVGATDVVGVAVVLLQEVGVSVVALDYVCAGVVVLDDVSATVVLLNEVDAGVVLLDEVDAGVVLLEDVDAAVVARAVVDVVVVVVVRHSPSHTHCDEHPSPETTLPLSHSSIPDPSFNKLPEGHIRQITVAAVYRSYCSSSPTEKGTMMFRIVTSAPQSPTVICSSDSS